jgi:myb proto-oncogene protein
MSPRTEHEEEQEEQEKDDLSGSEDDDALDEDMEALRRACMLTGRNPNDLHNPSTSAANGDFSSGPADSDSDDDLELARNIQNRFSISSALCETLSLEPVSSLPPATSDEDDDFETLLAIQRRFSSHATGKSAIPICLCVHFVVENFE